MSVTWLKIITVILLTHISVTCTNNLIKKGVKFDNDITSDVNSLDNLNILYISSDDNYVSCGKDAHFYVN